MRVEERGEMLHQRLAQSLREQVVRRRRVPSDADEDLIGRL